MNDEKNAERPHPQKDLNMKEDTIASDGKEKISDADHGIKSRMMFFQQCILGKLNSKKIVNLKRFLLNPKKWGLRKRFLFTTGLFLFAGIISLGFFHCFNFGKKYGKLGTRAVDTIGALGKR